MKLTRFAAALVLFAFSTTLLVVASVPRVNVTSAGPGHSYVKMLRKEGG